MMTELQPLIRIGLYILAGYLARAGLPAELANTVSADPVFADLVGQALAALVAAVALVWWRIAKRLGMAT